MGELILCGQTLAELPYYLEEAAINVYSLEELSYYIENNLYLLEADFMKEELCVWIEKELKLAGTAEKLREIYRGDGTLSEFLGCLLEQSGYLSKERIQQIVAERKALEHKSDYECMKLKADRYVKNKAYLRAIYEYRKLLAQKDEKNKILVGNVWHNLGCAYAGLFLFQEAAVCYRNAYACNANQESGKECLYAYRCMQDAEGFERAARELQAEEACQLEVTRGINEACRLPDICAFEAQVEALFVQKQEKEISEVVTGWKDAYRKNSRI